MRSVKWVLSRWPVGCGFRLRGPRCSQRPRGSMFPSFPPPIRNSQSVRSQISQVNRLSGLRYYISHARRAPIRMVAARALERTRSQTAHLPARVLDLRSPSYQFTEARLNGARLAVVRESVAAVDAPWLAPLTSHYLAHRF